MIETQNHEEETPLISFENTQLNSKEDIFRKQLALGGLMLCVIMVSMLIANVK